MTSCLLQGKDFYCREWAFGKILHCLENRSTAKTCGVLVVGGPGCGKTALCCELVWPTSKVAKHRFLSKRLLAYHFCQAHDSTTLSISNFLTSLTKQLINWSQENLLGRNRLFSEQLANGLLHDMKSEHNLDAAFSVYFLPTLAKVDPPSKNLFILVDSIDESWSQAPHTLEGTSTTIAELLGKHHHLFPPWLLLICTARKQNKLITHLFTGFKKISLDDLKKTHVIRDVQQYILNRLDQDGRLKLQLSGESPETLNQLHIKCNGCFLYLEKVLNCVSERFFSLKEVRDIPGTLNGLYMWLCQKLFPDSDFSNVRPVLNVLLASQRPISDQKLCTMLGKDGEDFFKIMSKLSLLLVEGRNGAKILFHHSFSEWLLDVKHCTNRFLCDVADGHARLALNMSLVAYGLKPTEIKELAMHLIKASKSNYFASFDRRHVVMWLLTSGVDVEDALKNGLSDDFLVNELLIDSGAILPEEFYQLYQEQVTMHTLNNSHEDQPKKDGLRWKHSMSQSQNSCKDVEKDDEHSLSGKKALSDSHEDIQSQREDTKLHGQSSGKETSLAVAVRNGDANTVKNILLIGDTDINQIDADGWTLLRCAAWGGHKDVVDVLLEVGVDVDQSDKDGRTALRAAAWGGHEEVVLQLLNHHANVNKADKEGRTPLIAAAYMGHSQIVEYLVEFGADVNHEDIDGRTALSVASLCVPASEGHLKVVNQLLECGADPNHCDREGMSPLLVAAYEGLDGVCELLLENDADIDHTDNSGKSALQAAVSMGHYKTVSLLLFWGAAIDAIDAEGRTVLGLASQQGNIEVVKLLLNRGLDETHRDNSGWTPLHIAAFEGHKKVVEILLEAGARLMETDNDGKVAMILAAQEGHADVVCVLLDLGTPTEVHGHDGHTALRCAAVIGHEDVVGLLLARGADINCKDADGRTILHALALETEKTRKNFSPEKAVKMATFLLDNHINPEERDLEERTPLHLSALHNNYLMAELLLTRGRGSDLVLSDCEGRTALHLAALKGFSSLVELFLERGAEINVPCVRGETALWLASKEGHSCVVAILLKWGGDPEIGDNQGRTPYRIASKHGHQNVLKLLRDFGCSSKIALGIGGSKKMGSSPSTVTSGLGSSLERKNLEAFVNGHGKQMESSRPYLLHAKSGRSPVTCRSFSTNQSSSSSGCESGLGRQQMHPQMQRKQDYMRQSKSIDYSAHPIPPSSSSLLINSLLSPVQEPSHQKNRSSASSPPYSRSFLTSPAVSCQLVASPLSEVHSFKASPLGLEENLVKNAEESFQPDEMVIEPIWQRHQEMGHTGKAGRNIGSASNGISSPEARKKRNGIVTNPCFSSASSSVTLDSAAHSPSTSASRGAVLRPKGLVLKRETPL